MGSRYGEGERHAGGYGAAFEGASQESRVTLDDEDG